MIREHHQDIPDDFRVSVPTVHPWARFPECTKCGASIGHGVRFVGVLLAAWGRSAQSYAYCKGDQNSQVQMPTLNVQTGELGTRPLAIPCFGIVEEHLHIHCGRCGFDWLMQCKGGPPQCESSK